MVSRGEGFRLEPSHLALLALETRLYRVHRRVTLARVLRRIPPVIARLATRSSQVLVLAAEVFLFGQRGRSRATGPLNTGVVLFIEWARRVQ